MVEWLATRLRNEISASECISQTRDFNKVHKGFNNPITVFLCVIYAFCWYNKQANVIVDLLYLLEYRLCSNRQSHVPDLEILKYKNIAVAISDSYPFDFSWDAGAQHSSRPEYNKKMTFLLHLCAPVDRNRSLYGLGKAKSLSWVGILKGKGIPQDLCMYLFEKLIYQESKQ